MFFDASHPDVRAVAVSQSFGRSLHLLLAEAQATASDDDSECHYKIIVSINALAEKEDYTGIDTESFLDILVASRIAPPSPRFKFFNVGSMTSLTSTYVFGGETLSGIGLPNNVSKYRQIFTPSTYRAGCGIANLMIQSKK
jgi:hypothetical protein